MILLYWLQSWGGGATIILWRWLPKPLDVIMLGGYKTAQDVIILWEGGL